MCTALHTHTHGCPLLYPGGNVQTVATGCAFLQEPGRFQPWAGPALARGGVWATTARLPPRASDCRKGRAGAWPGPVPEAQEAVPGFIVTPWPLAKCRAAFPGAKRLLTWARDDPKDAPPDGAGRGLRRREGPAELVQSGRAPQPGRPPPGLPAPLTRPAHPPRARGAEHLRQPRRTQPQPPRRHRPARARFRRPEASASGAPPGPAPGPRGPAALSCGSARVGP